MNNHTLDTYAFFQHLFDDPTTARRAAQIAQAILAAKSARLTDIAAHMSGSSEASYKRLHRFLQEADPREALWRLFNERAEFVIGDVTEIERRQARQTEYVGTLKDGKTRGFWVLVLSTPYRGRAIPCGVITYSSRTIETEGSSRNRYHFEAFALLKALLGQRPLVLDREFSYEQLLHCLKAEGVHFVIRVNLGSRAPRFLDSAGREVSLQVARGETVVYRAVRYKGEVVVNLIGCWGEGFSEPLWVMTDLEPTVGLAVYFSRMKIEESFRDLKALLGMGKVMNKRQERMEKVLALLLLVYAVGFLVGEVLRDYLYGGGCVLGEGCIGGGR